MKIHFKVAVLVACLNISYSCFAKLGKPEACPAFESIKAQGLELASEIISHSYGVFQFSDYGTSRLWAFGIGLVKASNEEDALQIGKTLLSGLSGHPEPEELEKDMWSCVYQLDNPNYEAIAYQSDSFDSFVKLKPYLMRKR